MFRFHRHHQDKFSKSMRNALSADTQNVFSCLMEPMIDSITKDGVFREIPVISTGCSIINLLVLCHHKLMLAKHSSFIEQFNAHQIDETKRTKYAEDFRQNAKKREKELEYLLIILDRYNSIDQARFLGDLYSAYLDSKIDWLALRKYAEVIDRFLPGDYEVLATEKTYSTEGDLGTDAIQRLIGLGLVIEEIREPETQEDSDGIFIVDHSKSREKKERHYIRTTFGDKFVEITSISFKLIQDENNVSSLIS